MVYADVLTLTGRSITFSTEIQISKLQTNYIPSDPDDSWSDLKSNEYRIVLKNNKPVTVNELQEFKFEVHNKNNQRQNISNYMGMLGHGALLKKDLSLFAHIHPLGTISMLSFDHTMHIHTTDLSDPNYTVSFPFKFYKNGAYYLWIQLKINGEIINQKFNIKVG